LICQKPRRDSIFALVKTTKHPNRIPFEGVLARLDQASDAAPSGARGHRVLLTTAAAEEAIESLIGMAVGFKTGFDGHDARQRCGMITEAWIEESAVHVRGHIFGRDFPDVIKTMETQEDPLGMSYELADAHVADMRAQVWTVIRATFVGAAILRAKKAAYRTTRINLSAEIERFTGELHHVQSKGRIQLVKRRVKRCTT
jgi:hypothetical protein